MCNPNTEGRDPETGGHDTVTIENTKDKPLAIDLILYLKKWNLMSGNGATSVSIANPTQQSRQSNILSPGNSCAEHNTTEY